MDTNKVTITGTIQKIPVVRYSQKGTAFANFNLALKGKDDKFICFPSCVAFGEEAQKIEQKVGENTPVEIEGHIQTGSYKDKDGRKVYTTNIVVDSIVIHKVEAPHSDDIPEGFSMMDDGIPF